jgi:hypothetical protein
MRETELKAQIANNRKRLDLAMSQFEFLESRQRALELVLDDLSIMDKVKLVIGGNSLKSLVDAKHQTLYNEAKAERERMVKEAIEKARKPKIIVPQGLNGHGKI